MLRILKRTGQAIVTFLAATTLAFFLYRMLPGGPVSSLAAQRFFACQRSSQQQVCDYEEIRQQVAARLGIDPGKSAPVAYYEWIEGIVLHQDFGVSTTYAEPVFDILFQAMPWSIFISLFGLVLGLSFNIFWGAMLAYKEGTRFDKGGTMFSLVGNAIPYYVAAIIALALLGFHWGIFPSGGRYPSEFVVDLPVVGIVIEDRNLEPGVTPAFILAATYYAALPIFTGFVLGISGLSMRGNAIRVMESDYLHVAELRGLSQARLASRYVARNAILPLYTGFMIGISAIFSSSIITERIFTYPAVGWYTFNALVTRDYPLVMGSFVFYTGITIIGIFVADLTYGYVDPRAGGSNEAH